MGSQLLIIVAVLLLDCGGQAMPTKLCDALGYVDNNHNISDCEICEPHIKWFDRFGKEDGLKDPGVKWLDEIYAFKECDGHISSMDMCTLQGFDVNVRPGLKVNPYGNHCYDTALYVRDQSVIQLYRIIKSATVINEHTVNFEWNFDYGYCDCNSNCAQNINCEIWTDSTNCYEYDCKPNVLMFHLMMICFVLVYLGCKQYIRIQDMTRYFVNSHNGKEPLPMMAHAKQRNLTQILAFGRLVVQSEHLDFGQAHHGPKIKKRKWSEEAVFRLMEGGFAVALAFGDFHHCTTDCNNGG